MRNAGNVYEYIAVYVDDLAIVAKDPKNITDVHTDKYKFKLKDSGPIKFHLGCDFYRDDQNTLCLQPKKYIAKMINGYELMFGEKPKHKNSPLDKGDRPELDQSELLDAEGTQKYQSLIGSLQWAVTLGRIDIATAVMSLSSYRAAPRQGHMERAQRIYGYLAKFNEATIRVHTDEPDYSGFPEQNHDWSYSVYGNVKEEHPVDAPQPLGKYVTLTHYVDANLYHDALTG
jgi:hypothetical protein